MKKLLLLLIVVTSFKSFSQDHKIIWDTIFYFNSSYEFLINDTAKTNIWQIGIPQKTFFDSAYSSLRCIVTDTLNTYPVNNLSFFDLYISENNHSGYPYSTFIEFKHKFDTDTLKDGGFITVSQDNGRSWTSILNEQLWEFLFTEYNNLYRVNDTLFNGEQGFSGKSDSWQTTIIGWYAMPVKSTQYEIGDTMIIRFNFISDSIDNNKEGWMIDNIRFYEIQLGGGAIKKIGNSAMIKVFPNPVNNYLNICLDRVYSEIRVKIITVKGELIYTNKFLNRKEILLDNLSLQNGVYFLLCIFENELMDIKKVIIEK